MKKLTKKNLQQLSETMTILCEAEQRKCMGAAFYYAYDGTFLGSYGAGYEIRLVDQNIFYYQVSYGDDTFFKGDSQSLYDADQEAKYRIINSIATYVGFANNFVNVYEFVVNNEYDNIYTVAKTTHYLNGDVAISFNSNSLIFQIGNYYDLLCTMIHEKDHYDTPEDSHDKALSEYLAYYDMIHSEIFQYTSSLFQDSAREQLKKFEKELYDTRDNYYGGY